jgi:hypothetical protein
LSGLTSGGLYTVHWLFSTVARCPDWQRIGSKRQQADSENHAS